LAASSAKALSSTSGKVDEIPAGMSGVDPRLIRPRSARAKMPSF
jgi:hypothetical protein